MMPQGGPVNFGNLARAAQAYAYHLQRGGDEAGAQRAALVHVSATQLDQAVAMGQAAREAARVVGLSSAGNEGWFNLQRSASSTPGATTETYTVAVNVRLPEGQTQWRTFQESIPRGMDLAAIQARLATIAQDMASGSEYGYGGELEGYETQTVIGHTPGVG